MTTCVSEDNQVKTHEWQKKEKRSFGFNEKMQTRYEQSSLFISINKFQRTLTAGIVIALL